MVCSTLQAAQKMRFLDQREQPDQAEARASYLSRANRRIVRRAELRDLLRSLMVGATMKFLLVGLRSNSSMHQSLLWY
jgi:hypothetical protein